MAKPKYTAKFVKKSFLHISNTTGQPVSITFEESAIDTISGTKKYSFVEVWECLKTVTGNTKKEIEAKYYDFTTVTNNYELTAIFI